MRKEWIHRSAERIIRLTRTSELDFALMQSDFLAELRREIEVIAHEMGLVVSDATVVQS